MILLCMLFKNLLAAQLVFLQNNCPINVHEAISNDQGTKSDHIVQKNPEDNKYTQDSTITKPSLGALLYDL